MKTCNPTLRSALLIGVAVFLILTLFPAAAADAAPPIPAVVQKGFDLWSERKAATWAMDIWKVGGLLENDGKPSTLSRYFGRLDRTIGDFKSFEAVDAKQIGQSSEILYVTLKFEHAVIYGRFLMYRTDKDWVVQNMDFTTRPEAIMPWLAFTGENYAD